MEEIAQGRVWSGAEAQKRGLVDELGGLDDAIVFAAHRAGLGNNYRLVEFPRQKDLLQAVQEFIEKHTSRSARTQSTSLGAKIVERFEGEVKVLRSFRDPLGVYARLPLNLSIR